MSSKFIIDHIETANIIGTIFVGIKDRLKVKLWFCAEHQSEDMLTGINPVVKYI